MKRVLIGTACLMLIASADAQASNRGNDKKTSAGTAAPRVTADTSAPRVAAPRGDRTSTSTSTQVVFSTEQVRVMRAHYAPRTSALPPGLQKKYARTGQLPPGWQKKMEPFPAALERSMPTLAAPYRRGIIDGHAVIYHSSAGTIIDVAVLF